MLFNAFVSDFLPNIFELEISFSLILDLTSQENLKILDLTEDELLAGTVYRSDEISLPNSLAKAAYESGFEGILVKSATMAGNNIILFPKNQLEKSSIHLNSFLFPESSSTSVML